LLAAGIACGPDPKPEEPCAGPTFDLTVRAPDGPLPDDTVINVRYGGNNDGEPYTLGETRTPQAVFCSAVSSCGGELSGGGGAASGASGTNSTERDGAGDGTAGGSVPGGFVAIECRLYTQGPARLDVNASGYAPIVERDLTLAQKRCQVEVDVVLELPDPDTAGR